MTATAQASPLHETEFFLFMRASHQTLQRLIEKLLLAVTADDRNEMHRLWVEIEAKLLSHLEAEERYVLPAFARTDHKEACDLIREHGKIREALLEISVAIELHYARLEPLRQFISTLREHADREEALMYQWAASMLDERLAAAATNHINGR